MGLKPIRAMIARLPGFLLPPVVTFLIRTGGAYEIYEVKKDTWQASIRTGVVTLSFIPGTVCLQPLLRVAFSGEGYFLFKWEGAINFMFTTRGRACGSLPDRVVNQKVLQDLLEKYFAPESLSPEYKNYLLRLIEGQVEILVYNMLYRFSNDKANSQD